MPEEKTFEIRTAKALGEQYVNVQDLLTVLGLWQNDVLENSRLDDETKPIVTGTMAAIQERLRDLGQNANLCNPSA